MNVSSAATRNASESPVPSAISRNQGCPARPRTWSATALMSKVTIRADTPTPPPRISASASRVVTSPERRMPMTMKVIAVMLWVIAPATAPQARAENRFPVHRPAALRSRRVASAFTFSVRIHIPTMKRPRPPAIPATSSFTSRWRHAPGEEPPARARSACQEPGENVPARQTLAVDGSRHAEGHGSCRAGRCRQVHGQAFWKGISEPVARSSIA